MNKAFVILIAGMLSAPVFAHDGDRIWIDAQSGKLRTYATEAPQSPNTPSRIFSAELQNFFDIYTTEFPGYQLRAGTSVPTNTSFGFKITGPLLVFDDVPDAFATTKAKFGAVTTPQMGVSLTEARFTGDGPVDGFTFFNYGPEDHAHLAYTMVAGEEPYNGPAGVYALSMSLSANGFAASDPYYILIGKGVSPTAPLFVQARQTMQKMLDLPGDLNLDGVVSQADLNALALHWQGQSGRWNEGDFNFDGIVNITDLKILADHWQQSAPLGPLLDGLGLNVPEPGAVMVAIPALLGSLGARRRALRRVATES